jgi:uncharacterized protein YifE (UPF0438 family)
METNERILISQNDSLAEQIKSDLTYFKAPFNKLVEAFEALDLGRLTPETFDEIRTGQAAKSVSRYQTKLEKDLDDTGVKNATLRANLLVGTGEIAGTFLKAARAFMDTTFKPRGYGRSEDQVLTVDFISLDEDGALTISDEGFEGILETHCRTYLQTDEEKELYAAVDHICTGYKNLIQKCKHMKLGYNFEMTFGVMDHLITNIGPTVSPSIVEIKKVTSKQARR